jgi:hypothetical protein
MTPITDEVYTFAEGLSRKAEEDSFTKSIGSTYAPHSTLFFVTSDDNCSDHQLEEPEKSEEDKWDDMEDVIASGMASASAGFASGVNPKHLSKIWRNLFGWYEWCYYREHTATFPNQQEVLGRVLGPARGEGNEMCQ